MSRLTDEQELGKRTEHDQADTPENREARIKAHIAHYERLGLRGGRQRGSSRQLVNSPGVDAAVLDMIRQGRTVIELADHFGKSKQWVYHAKERAQARESAPPIKIAS